MSEKKNVSLAAVFLIVPLVMVIVAGCHFIPGRDCGISQAIKIIPELTQFELGENSECIYVQDRKSFSRIYLARKKGGYLSLGLFCNQLVKHEICSLPPAEEEILHFQMIQLEKYYICLLYTSPSPRDRQKSRMPSSA